MRRFWVYPLAFLVLFASGFAAWSNGSGARAIVCSAPEPQTVVITETIVVTQTPQPAIDCGKFVALVRVGVPQGFLNVRPFPTTEYAPIGVVAEGEWVEFLEQSGDWYRIRTDNLEGWVYSRYVSEPECANG